MTIDDYIEQRNAIQFKAELISEEAAAARWIELGVANRHIERVLAGEMQLTPAVEYEIADCLRRNSV